MKRAVLFISIILAGIFNHGKLLASKVYSSSSEEHKEHNELKSNKPLPVYIIETPGLLTIYFEAAIGEVNLTITDKNNEIIYINQHCIGSPMSLTIELDMLVEEYTVYIEKL